MYIVIICLGHIMESNELCHKIPKSKKRSCSPIIGPVSGLTIVTLEIVRVVLSCIIAFLLHLVKKEKRGVLPLELPWFYIIIIVIIVTV